MIKTKYQIGDIITNSHNHYLVEDIDFNRYKRLFYFLRRLEDNLEIDVYASTIDSNLYVIKVA